ncbi:MAG: phytanoyl-CoA dioxygenase family protein [Rhodospirillaceae bacterium]|nr:phytanoyl-CoA dioxygenase family protein [Rhodospirillaceae bacterium]
MTEPWVAHYREHGYAIVPGVFDADEIAAIAAQFDLLYRQGLAHGRSYRDRNSFFAVTDDAALGTIVRMVQWPSYFNAALERIRRDARMLDIVAPLLGTDLKQIINQLHWKPPGAAMTEFGFHQDSRSRRPREAYRDFAASYVQTGIAIDPHRAENGAMTVYPGSHRLGEIPFDPNRRTMNVSLDGRDLERLGLDPAKAVTLTLAPGDVALWGMHTLHGSGANSTASDRRFYLNGYVIAENCDRGEWAWRDAAPCPLPDEPSLVHYEALHEAPGPMYVD